MDKQQAQISHSDLLSEIYVRKNKTWKDVSLLLGMSMRDIADVETGKKDLSEEQLTLLRKEFGFNSLESNSFYREITTF